MNAIPLGERYVDLGVKAIDQDDLEKALRYLNRALSLDPDSYLAYYNRAVVYDMLERLPEALADYDRALAIQPNHLASQHNRAVLLRELGRAEEAIAAFDAVLRYDPDNGDVLYNRGIAHADLAQWDDALRDYERAIACDPQKLDARIAKGNALLEMGDVERALAMADDALQRDPTSVEARVLRGMARFDGGAAAEANRGVHPGARAHARRPWGAAASGIVLLKLKRNEEAIRDLRDALKNHPDCDEAFYHLAIAYLQLGDREAAIDALQKAIDIHPPRRLEAQKAKEFEPLRSEPGFKAVIAGKRRRG